MLISFTLIQLIFPGGRGTKMLKLSVGELRILPSLMQITSWNVSVCIRILERWRWIAMYRFSDSAAGGPPRWSTASGLHFTADIRLSCTRPWQSPYVLVKRYLTPHPWTSPQSVSVLITVLIKISGNSWRGCTAGVCRTLRPQPSTSIANRRAATLARRALSLHRASTRRNGPGINLARA